MADVEREVARGAVYHTGLRLSAVAIRPILLHCRRRQVRTVVEPVDAAAGLSHSSANRLVHLGEKIFGHDAVGNSGLTRHHHYLAARAAQQPNRIARIRKRFGPPPPLRIPPPPATCS